MSDSIKEKVTVGVITAIILGGLTLLWNWGSSGGLVRVLGGLTEAEVDAKIAALPTPYSKSEVDQLINDKLLNLQSGLSEPAILALVSKEIEEYPHLTEAQVQEIASSTIGVSGVGLDREAVQKLISEETATLQAFTSMKGAVIAFDRSEDRGGGEAGGACPIGWTLFREAGGRMILGAGSHDNADENGAALSRYDAFSDAPSRAVGGEEAVTLETEDMPQHTHSGTYLDITVPGAGPNPVMLLPDTAGGAQKGTAKAVGGITGRDGPVRPHNNMPPYIALYFCKKEG